MPYYIKRKKKVPKTETKTKRGTDYVKKLDKVFSLYIRVRDAMPGGLIRCISCGQIKPFEKFDNGHYYSRTHMSTRFDEDNCNAECSFCNRFKADHMDGYRRHLIEKIGLQRFELLEVKVHQTKKWSDFELKELIKYYTALTEKLKKDKGL